VQHDAVHPGGLSPMRGSDANDLVNPTNAPHGKS
jgi:hypothetical protein